MRGLTRHAAVVAGAAVALLGPAVGVASAAGGVAAGTYLVAGGRAVSGGSWGTAIEVPGTAALNQSGYATVTSVSCASAGNCSAAGYYSALIKARNVYRPFVANQTNGTWGTAEEVSGFYVLHADGNIVINSVSCASAGNCSAGGYYQVFNGKFHVPQAFVVSERNGTWHSAKEIPGAASITSVSCASAGNCSAGGSGGGQAVVVSETNGTWGTAEEVPGSAALNTDGYASVTSVSCASAGNCSAGGYYEASGAIQAFVVSETNGTWGKAKEVPGTAALNTDGYASVTSVSCASAGNCSAGGNYSASCGPTCGTAQAFVVSKTNGTWGKAKEVPGTAALNQGGAASIASVSCASAGNCSAGGYYLDSSDTSQALVVNEVNGTWGIAEEVPGTAALNQDGNGAKIGSVSCGAAGNCSAGGYYADSSGRLQAFVVSQTSGTWHTAKEVPGTAALNQGGDASITSVSCASAGHCSAGGNYYDASVHRQAFVVNKT